MLLWHMGAATLLVYATLGRSRIDYRFILLGAIAPDIADGLADLWLYPGSTGRGFAHSLTAVVVVAIAVLLLTRGPTRLSLFGLPVGWLLHLVADGMWQSPLTFLWPAFGTRFSEAPSEPYSWRLFTSPTEHLGTWGAELAGALVLVWFWIAFLRTSDRRRRFLRDGLLRA